MERKHCCQLAYSEFVKYEGSTNQKEIVIDSPIALASSSVYRDSYYST